MSSDAPSTANGTGVFIPACILDGSALKNPAIGKFPRKRRGGSAISSPSSGANASDKSSSPASARSESPGRGKGNGKGQKQQHKDRVASEAPAPDHVPSPDRQEQQLAQLLERDAKSSIVSKASAQAGEASASSSAVKNPFAATPKNIRQHQLLCNLVAAADGFPDPATVPIAALGTAGLPWGSINSAGSRAPSHDLPPAPAGGKSVDLTRTNSRTSLESSYYHYTVRSSMDARSSMDVRSSMDARSSMDVRPSIDMGSVCPSICPSVDETSYSYSVRSSCDYSNCGNLAARFVAERPSMESTCMSGRPSVDSSWSSYATVAPGTTVGYPGRGSLDLSLPQSMASSTLSAAPPRQHSMPTGRPGIDLGATPGLALTGRNALLQHRHSFDALAAAAAAGSEAGATVAAAATAAAVSSALWQQVVQQQQQQVLQQQHSRIRRDNSNLSNTSSASAHTSLDTSCVASPSIAACPTDLAAAAAALAAAQNVANGDWEAVRSAVAQAQLAQQVQQQLLVAGGGCEAVNGSYLFQTPEAGLLLQQLSAAAAAGVQLGGLAGSSGSNAPNTNAASLQQQLLISQQLQLLLQQQQQILPVSMPLSLSCQGCPPLPDASTSLDTDVSAASLQQQLELLQMLQL